MADDSSPLATKKDLKEFADMLMKQIHDLYEANQTWKDEILEEIDKLYKSNEQWKDEIIRGFKIVSEDIRHDAFGANKDQISVLADRSEDHGKRIIRLEKNASLLPA